MHVLFFFFNVDVTVVQLQPDAEKNEALQHGADVTSVFYTADNKAILTSSQVHFSSLLVRSCYER